MINKETLQKIAKTRKIKKWFRRECSICSYPLGYVFSPDYSYVGFDIGCNCTSYGYIINESSWEDLTHDFNACEHPEDINNRPEDIKNRDDCWGILELSEEKIDD